MNNILQANKEKIYNMTTNVLHKIEYMCEKNKDKVPYTLMEDGTYNDLDYIDSNPDLGINWWTNGFFAGILWQMYQETSDMKYLKMARLQEEKLDQCFALFEGIHHDAGFMWQLSAVADFQLTGDRHARVRGMHAATILAGRFNMNGNFIRAWNGPGGKDLNSVIIDSLMNMSLLHWAYEESKDPRFQAIAIAHTNTIAKYFVREDGSVNHIIKFDPNTGEMLEALGGQGYREGSAWSRGQAWAIYGFANAYRHTKKEEYLELSCKVADYFKNNLREGNAVPVDFCQPQEDESEDNSAACIAASGLLTLAELVSSGQKENYLETAWQLIRKVYKTRICLDSSKEALVQQCAVSYAERMNGPKTLIYADYFYLEAILKLSHHVSERW